MKVSVHSVGTRGDVQPYVALACALQDAGHEVLLVAPAQFAAVARQRGIPFAPLPSAFLELLHEPEVAAAIAGGQRARLSLRALLARYRPIMEEILRAEAAAADAFRPDIFVYHPKALGAPRIAVHHMRPAVLASPLPGFTPTAAFPSPLVPLRTLGPLNALSHVLTAKSADLLFRGMLREWERETFGSAGKGTPSPAGTQYAYSPEIVPAPREWRDARVLVSGYWFLEEPDWRPEPELSAFLEAGPPPVYVGFGSMPVVDKQRLTQSVLDALEQLGHRAILASGWGGLGKGQLPTHVHALDQAPHSWLFPRMATIVHHGGAGTTGAALRAGRPSVVYPFLGDQPFWARRIADLGAGPEPLPSRRLSPDALAARLRQAADQQIAERCEEIGRRVRAERGLDLAVRFIEELADC